LAEFSKFLEYPDFGKPGNKRKYPSRALRRHIMAKMPSRILFRGNSNVEHNLTQSSIASK